MSATSLLTLRAISPRSAPIITPSLMTAPAFSVSAPHLAHQACPAVCPSGTPRRAPASSSFCTSDSAGWCRPPPRRCPRRRRPAARSTVRVVSAHVRTGQDRKSHQGNVFLQRDGHDVLDALPDTGVDDLEARVAQRARDDLGAAVVAVQAGFARTSDDSGADHLRTPPAAGTRPTPTSSVDTISPTVQ